MQKRRTAEQFIADLKETQRGIQVEETFETVWYVFSILANAAICVLIFCNLLNPAIGILIPVFVIVLNRFIDHKYSLDLYKKIF